MDDHPEATAPPASDGPSRTPPGRNPGYIDERRRAELLDLIASGKGVRQALRALAIPYTAYRNTSKLDPEFTLDVADARRAADDELDETGRLQALTGDTDVLFALWARRDKAKHLNQARRDRARERAEDAADRRVERALRLHLAEMAAEARAKERAERSGAADDGPEAMDFSRLPDDELATLRALLDKVRGDADATPGA